MIVIVMHSALNFPIPTFRRRLQNIADEAIITQETANRVIGTPFKLGNAGRPPGIQNKLSKTVKETVLAVFNELQDDPDHNLAAFAKKEPLEFYRIAAKLIPTELTGSVKHIINVTDQDND